TPELSQALTHAGHQVKVVATGSGLYFFDPRALDPGRTHRNPDVVIVDDDEWPGRAEGWHYQRCDKVLHIELRRWADVLLIAPLDANTLAKLATGLCNNCLTCVWRAWDRTRPVVLAPAMNTLMWEHPFTGRHLRQVAADAVSGAVPPADLELLPLIDWINEHCAGLHVVPPVNKRLACDDVGIGAMASVEDLVATVQNVVAEVGGRG